MRLSTSQFPTRERPLPAFAIIADADALISPIEKESILIVDDSRIVRRVFSNHLSTKYQCFEAGSFDEAIFELKRQSFAIVITDIIMPGLSGIELLRKILEQYPDTAVIVASGVDRPQRALDAIRLGAFDYLIKPCEPAVLQLTDVRALEHRNLVRDARKYKLELETRNAELIEQKCELERLQAQIVQSAKMASLGQLAAGVAHELNNPVGFVYSNIEMLEKYVANVERLVRSYDEADPSVSTNTDAAAIKADIQYPDILDDIRSMLLDCRDGSERIREIVQNLRTFSRLDEADYADTDLHEGIDSTLRLLSRHLTSGNLTLSRDDGEVPKIGAYSGPLNQVWMNLLVNAAQAVGTGTGSVTVSTRADDEYVYVEVTDTGCGIAVQNLNRIFDPFYTTKPVGEGTGLGLSISFGIVERHGGTISVATNLGQGTTFGVTLPRKFVPEADMDEKSIMPFFPA